MKHNGPTEERFLQDVASHKLRVVHDHGLHRHLVLSAGSFNQQFTITTAKGTLLFTGDMGTFVFERIDDMFQFFRSRVNPDYWAEKCQAADRRTGGLSSFDRAVFDNAVAEHVAEFIEDHGLTEDEAERLREEVKEALLNAQEDDWRGLVRELDTFEFTDDGGREYPAVFGHEVWLEFGRSESWNYHFIWCCYAIHWAIQQYDAWKAAEEANAAALEGSQLFADVFNAITRHIPGPLFSKRRAAAFAALRAAGDVLEDRTTA